MIGQGKTALQADIDSIAELVDFLKFNVQYGKVILIIHQSGFPVIKSVANKADKKERAITSDIEFCFNCNLSFR